MADGLFRDTFVALELIKQNVIIWRPASCFGPRTADVIEKRAFEV